MASWQGGGVPARDLAAGAAEPAVTAASTDVIDAYLHRLGRALHGPARMRADLLAEARDSLHDAAAAYRADGLDDGPAQRLAVDEFGTVGELADAYQDELAAGAVRGLALRTVLAFVAVAGGSVLMWWGAPWTGTQPPADYRALATWLDRLNYAVVGGALLAYGWSGWSGRRGRFPRGMARAVGLALTLGLLATAAAGTVIFVWSVRLAPAAATWPPMLLGIGLLAVAYGWLGRAAWGCLASGRRSGR